MPAVKRAMQEGSVVLRQTTQYVKSEPGKQSLSSAEDVLEGEVSDGLLPGRLCRYHREGLRDVAADRLELRDGRRRVLPPSLLTGFALGGRALWHRGRVRLK